jgi:hypothetical protein
MWYELWAVVPPRVDVNYRRFTEKPAQQTPAQKEIVVHTCNDEVVGGSISVPSKVQRLLSSFKMNQFHLSSASSYVKGENLMGTKLTIARPFSLRSNLVRAMRV